MPARFSDADQAAVLARHLAGDPFFPIPPMCEYIDRLEDSLGRTVRTLTTLLPDYARRPADEPLWPGAAMTAGELQWAVYLLTEPPP